MYLALKHFHITCVVLSGAGFALRGAWALAGSPLARARLTRVLPHVVDSCLLLSAIALAWMAGQYPFVHGWLTAKIVGLLAYIGLGTVALKRGKTKILRISALVLAVGVFAYIVAVAITKQAVPGLG